MLSYLRSLFQDDNLYFSDLDGDVAHDQDFTFFDKFLDFFGYVGSEQDEFDTFFEDFKENHSMWSDNYNQYGSRYEPENSYQNSDPYLDSDLTFDDDYYL